MMVGFEDTTEDKKWLVPKRNKNIKCFFSDGNKSEHQDKCLSWRMLTSSIGSSETQLTLNIPQKVLIAKILFWSIWCYLEGSTVLLGYPNTSIFASGQKNILLQSWIDWRMISVIPFRSSHKNFLQTTINKKYGNQKVWV